MTIEEKARAYDEAKERMRAFLKEWENCGAYGEAMEKARSVFPELRESEGERIRKAIVGLIEELQRSDKYFAGVELTDMLAYLEKQKDLNKMIVVSPEVWDNAITDAYENRKKDGEKQKEKKPIRDIVSGDAIESCMLRYLQSAANRKDDIEIIEDTKAYKSELISIIEKEQKPIKMEVYEVGKGTTICGQDYKCKKDYKEGNCWYIKDVIYHCGRDGYLNDQNGVSWSCTPEWFNEYIYTNDEWADKEKNDFVSGQFLQCKLSFDDFKEGEHYWLEYVGDDMYVGRSDNILNQKFHITPRQLYTLFSEKLEEVQGPPQEEKQVSLNYEPPFDENPSDKEIIDALIHSLNEQDGFLTAIDGVSTKAILNWLEKQKERGPLTKEEEYTLHRIIEYLEDEICPSEWVNLLHDIYCLPYQKQKEPHYTKRNALFDKCVENCDPKVMKEVSDEIDEMLEKEQKPSHKFNVGDIIHCKYDDREFTIKSVDLANGVYKYTKEGCGNDIDYADENFELVEQKPAEWSEDKDKVNIPYCSSEPEWSDEDEKLLDFWLDVIDRNDWRMDENFCKASREFINRIKSFRPSWKPSKEQMEVLRRALHINPASGKLHYLKENEVCILQGLLKQLEKL